MDLIEAIRSRRSIRKFKPDPVPDEHIRELINAARLAPSGTNLQPWRFVIIKSSEARNKLSQCTPLPFVSQAPVIIACCIDNKSLETTGIRVSELRESGAFANTPLDNAKTENYARANRMDEATAKAYLGLNTAIAVDHLTLRAVDLGLGTCWVMMFDRDQISRALNLEDRYNVFALIPLGYPDQEPSPRPRLALDEIVLKEL